MSIIDVVKRKLKEREDEKEAREERRLVESRVERIKLEKRASVIRSTEREKKRIEKAKKTIGGGSGGVAGFLQGIGKGMNAPRRKGKKGDGMYTFEGGFDDLFGPQRRQGKVRKFKEIRFD